MLVKWWRRRCIHYVSISFIQSEPWYNNPGAEALPHLEDAYYYQLRARMGRYPEFYHVATTVMLLSLLFRLYHPIIRYHCLVQYVCVLFLH